MSSTTEKTSASEILDDVTRQAKSTFEQVKSSAIDTGKTTLTDLKAKAADMAETMKDGLEARADVAKDGLAEGGLRIAETIRQSAGEPGSMQAKVLDLVATNVADLSEQLRGRDLKSIMSDVQGFARSNPALFVAGAAVAGFAMARFLRSSSRPDVHDAGFDAYQANMQTGMTGGTHSMGDEAYQGVGTDSGMAGHSAGGYSETLEDEVHSGDGAPIGTGFGIGGTQR